MTVVAIILELVALLLGAAIGLNLSEGKWRRWHVAVLTAALAVAVWTTVAAMGDRAPWLVGFGRHTDNLDVLDRVAGTAELLLLVRSFTVLLLAGTLIAVVGAVVRRIRGRD